MEEKGEKEEASWVLGLGMDERRKGDDGGMVRTRRRTRRGSIGGE
jgi:hypothetical protein